LPWLALISTLATGEHSPSATLFAPTAVGDTEGGIGATLLVLSSLKHLKYLQTYTYFQAQAEL
ncbi:hypothetical protein, partial [Shewanella sp. SE1]|uniref:hypothetical protein n=1 Tax=Shewanella sp. SE1 TaxID=2705014 RepID=UPI001EE47861